LEFFSGAMASMIPPDKTEVKCTVLPLNEEEEGLLLPALPEVPAYKK
jgi:hypothetical protein